MTRRNEGSGVSLAEVLIACALVWVFMYTIGRIVVQAYSTHVSRTEQAAEFRRGTVAMDLLGRELRLCSHLYQPELSRWAVGSAYVPRTGAAAPFVFTHYSTRTEQKIVVGYAWDARQAQVQRLLYSPDFDPGRAATHRVLERPRMLATSVQSFEITRVDPDDTFQIPFVQADLRLSPVVFPVTLKVRVKSF